jgi:hypothetical protein
VSGREIMGTDPASAPAALETKQKSPFWKFVTFVLANVAGGLVQLWVLYLILLTLNRSHDIRVLFGDGGLFFFATSLTFNSLLALVEKHTLRPGTADLNVTLVLAGSVTVSAMVIYSAVLSQGTSTASPFSSHVLAQLSCAIAALVYAFYVSIRTGYFSG